MGPPNPLLVLGGLAVLLLGGHFLTALWENLVFARVIRDTWRRKQAAVAAACLTGGALSGFVFADGNGFYWKAYIIWLVPAFTLLAAERRRRQDFEDHAKELEKTFE